MTRILITGGAGYLGSVLTQELLAWGYSVHVLDNFSHGQNSLANCCVYPKFEVTCGDVRNVDDVLPLLKHADVIIPLAAIVGAPACDADPIAASTINRDAIISMLISSSPDQHVIYPNTNSGYGTNTKICTEETPLNPISYYGVVKTETEHRIMKLGNAVTLRLATLFGASPRMRLDLLVNDFVHRAVTDRSIVVFEGDFNRNYLHVRDAAKAFLHAIENFDVMQGQVYNVGDSLANLSKLELCKRIKRHVPNLFYCEAPIRKDPDKRNYIVSNEKIEKTGWKPSYSLDDGIVELIKLYTGLRTSTYRNA